MCTNPFPPQRRKSRYAELDFEVGPSVPSPKHLGPGGEDPPLTWVPQVGRAPPPGLGLCPPPLQKIMHTRKRHQDMFQDLNRKLQHAEKDKEVLGPESKVWAGGQRVGGVGPWVWGRAARALR